jgi:hypothetical protein
MACYEKSNRLFNNILLFIFQFYYSGSGEKEDFKLPKTSLLYTLYKIPDLSKSFTHPPSQWIIFDSLNTNTNTNTNTNFNKPLSEEWPEPLYSTSFSNERTIAIQPVFPFADTTRAIQFTFNSINILILNNIPEHFSLDESSIFKERYSIIININPHRNETILQIRKLFRPLFLIIVPDNSEDILEGKNSNGILDVTEKSTFIIYKDSKGTVLVR